MRLLFSNLLVHVHAAIHTDGLASHEVAIVGGKKNHRADEIRGILIALESPALSPVGELLRRQDAFLFGTGDGQAGHNRIHADVVVANLARQGASKTDNCCVGSHVVKKERGASYYRSRRDVNDLAFALLLHGGVNRLTQCHSPLTFTAMTRSHSSPSISMKFFFLSAE